MIRLLALLLAALSGCATATPQPERLQVLRWTGKATVHGGERDINIAVRTRVAPFRSARSESWLIAQGPASTRAMIIEPQGGWIERGGKREPMPEAMLRHERQQFAIYGLMQLALAAGPPRSGGTLLLSRPPFGPPTRFTFAPEGRLLTAANRVDNPDGGAAIDQLFRFSGELRSGRLRWPRRIDILHGGKPYFTLELDSFEAEAERTGAASD